VSLGMMVVAALWMGLAVLSSMIARHLKVANALVEIIVGIVAGTVAGRFAGREALGAREPWLVFLAGAGAVVLTFLAGAELEPESLRRSWKEVLVVGFISFLVPFLGCAMVARYVLHWAPNASWLAGVALSTTSMAVVYAVLLELGYNLTAYGKAILGACFVTDLGTVIALGLLFAPFTSRTLIFAGALTAAFLTLPALTRRITARYAYKTAAIRTKWVLCALFGLGALAIWAGSEAVLPAYLVGMALAGTITKDDHFMRRIRTLTVGFLTPFYFLRAGTFVSLHALLAAPLAFLVLFGGKIITKLFGLLPVVGQFRRERKERWYYTLLMSTGLTFGSISAMYGLTHGIISQDQYSYLVAVVIASAVVPTLIANAVFAPKHLLKAKTEIE